MKPSRTEDRALLEATRAPIPEAEMGPERRSGPAEHLGTNAVNPGGAGQVGFPFRNSFTSPASNLKVATHPYQRPYIRLVIDGESGPVFRAIVLFRREVIASNTMSSFSMNPSVASCAQCN